MPNASKVSLNLLVEKLLKECWWKLTPDVDFINTFGAAFQNILSVFVIFGQKEIFKVAAP